MARAELPTFIVELPICILDNLWIVARILKRRIERSLRMRLEEISLDLEEEKELGVQLGC
jgi:hypothetical protein